MWPFKEITNADLNERDLPPFNSGWDQPLIKFARSLNGYRYIMDSQPSPENTQAIQRLGALANRAKRAYDEEKSLPQSLSDLRACLFFEERRWHHLGSAVGSYEAFDKGGRAMSYIHALLEAIARRIRGGERE